MKFKEPDGAVINLRKVNDEDYSRARSLSRTHLKKCPTCGGHEEYVASGIKQFVSKTYLHKDEVRECNCQLQIALETRYLIAGIGYEYMVLDWDDYDGDTEASHAVTNYVTNWESFQREGMGLMFSSAVQGVGKTWGAIHIGKEMIKRGQKVLFIDFMSMVDLLVQQSTHDETKQKMTETGFLILDEIRAGVSEAQNNLYATTFESVIRHRTMFNLPTITTTNLTEHQFEVNFERIYSLLSPKQVWLSLHGKDFRRSQQAEEAKIIRVTTNEVAPIV